jgi:hypothetical protein
MFAAAIIGMVLARAKAKSEICSQSLPNLKFPLRFTLINPTLPTGFWLARA